MKAILRVLLLLCVAAAVLAETCPPLEDIAPCTCDDDLGSQREIDIMCSNSAEMKKIDLKDHFKQLHGKKIGEMWLYKIPFKRIPTELFKGMHVRKLFLQNIDLEGVADKDDDLPFQGLEDSLEDLTIDECFVGANELKHFKLSHLKKLKELFVYDNKVPEVPNEWFQDGPASLVEVAFIGCHVKSVGDKAFVGLTNLEYINFANNNITVVGRSMVAKPAPKLHSIVVDHNRISNIPEDAYDDMPALTHVDLDDNDIRRLPEATWSRVWGQLEQLYLHGNPLQCDSHMDWMFGLKRPETLTAQCKTPEDRKGLFLDDIIDDHEAQNES